jgi:hypothetical protein
MLGFAGDIFSGMWDDSKYVQWAVEEWDRRYQEAEANPRQDELQNLALYLIDCEKTGKQMEAIKVWYAADTWSADEPTANEERMAVWGMLKHESKLRSAIKANKPEPVAA